MTLHTRHTPALHNNQPSLAGTVRCKGSAAWAASVLLAASVWGTAAAGAWAQGTPGAVAPEPQASAAASAPEAPAVPKYSAADIKTIFNYLDRNRDGAISREEAAGFKGVARNFDRADTNKDGMLSFEEFSFAMNRAK